MAQYLIQDTTLTAIADAIRAKTGSEEDIMVSDMASQIESISTGGGGSGGGSMEGVHTVTFMSQDGTTELYKRPVADDDDCADPVTRGYISAPTKASTAQYDYPYVGWATTPNGAWDKNALKAVTADKTVYAAFASVVRYYTITYYDDDGTTVLKTETLAYGAIPSYTPTKSGYTFDGWTPALATVTGNANYTAVWKVKRGLAEYTWAELDAMTLEECQANFALGEKKSVSFCVDAKGTQYTISFTLVGFGVDDLADGSGKAKMTFLTTRTRIKCVWGGTSGVPCYWPDSTPRATCQSIKSWSKNSEDHAALNAVIKPVKKKYVSLADPLTIATNDEFYWLASASELGFTTYSGNELADEGDCYPALAGQSVGSVLGWSFQLVTSTRSIYPKTPTNCLHMNAATSITATAQTSTTAVDLILGFCI